MSLGRSTSVLAALAVVLGVAPGTTAFGAAAPAAAPPLDAQQVAAIEKFIDQHGRKAVIDPDTIQRFKLAKDDRPVVVDQIALRDTANPQNRHILDRLADGSGYLVARNTPAVRVIYVVRKDLSLADCWVLSMGPTKVTATWEQAERGVRAELQLWAAKVAASSP